MERTIPAGDTLADDSRSPVDEDGHCPTLLRHSSLILNLSSAVAQSGSAARVRSTLQRQINARDFHRRAVSKQQDRVVGIFPGGHPLGAVRRRSLAKRGAELHR